MKNKNILNEVKFTLKDGKRKFLDKKLYKNILNERPRKRNNRKITKSTNFTNSKLGKLSKSMQDSFRKQNAIKKYAQELLPSIGLDTAHSDMSDAAVYVFMARECTKPNKNNILLNIGLCEKPQPMSKVQAFIIIALALLAFVGLFKAAQHAVDVHTLNTCEIHGDCAEVIRDINAH